MSITVPARAFADMVRRILAVIPSEYVPDPKVRRARVWTDQSHLLMEATDNHRAIRTRITSGTSSLDATVYGSDLAAAARLVPDVVQVARGDYEEVWTGTVDPARDWHMTVATRAGREIAFTASTADPTTVVATTHPTGEWKALDALWGRMSATVGSGPTALVGAQAAELLALAGDSDTSPAVIWPSGGDSRPTIMTLGADTIAMLMPCIDGDFTDLTDMWPGLLADTDGWKARP